MGTGGRLSSSRQEDRGAAAILLLHAAFQVILELLFAKTGSAVLALHRHSISHQLFVFFESLNVLFKLLLLRLHLNDLLRHVVIH